MKDGWEVRPLGEVATVVNGGTPKSAVGEYWNGGVPWITPKDMGGLSSPMVSETPRTISEAGLANCSARLVPPASIIMSTRAPIGYLAINERPMAFNQGCLGIVPLPVLDTHYARYFLEGSRQALHDLGTGATFPELSASALKAFPIPLPPLEEQRRIVAVLDEAFEGLARARANIEANLADAEEVFERRLDATFDTLAQGAPARALGDLGEVQTGSTPATRRPELYGGALAFVKPGDFRVDGTLDYGGASLSDAGRAMARVVAPGSVAMVCIGATIGKVGYTEREVATNQQINTLTPSEADAEFLHYQMRTKMFQAAVRSQAGQATLPIINKSKWSSLRVHVPEDIESQRNIAAELRELRSTLAEYQRGADYQLADLDALRQSLLARAFRGELT